MSAKPMTPLARSAARLLSRGADTIEPAKAGEPVTLADLGVTTGPGAPPTRVTPAVRGSGAVSRAVARQAGSPARTAAAVSTPPVPATPEAAPSTASVDESQGFPPGVRTPLTGMRRIIAERLSTSKREAPHYYMSTEVIADALLAMRRDLNEALAGEARLSVNDLVLALTARCLRDHGALNAAWDGDAVVHFDAVNLAVAVAVDGGLVTPVLRGAQGLGLMDLHREMSTLIDAARRRALPREAFQGGTFTVSNLGMYPVSQFAAIVNPPQAAILAIAAAERRVMALDDERTAIRRVMTVTLSVDHRIADGVAGAEFLADFKAMLEEPRRALL